MNILPVKAMSVGRAGTLNNRLKNNFKAEDDTNKKENKRANDNYQLANAVSFVASMAAVTGMCAMYGMDMWDRNQTLKNFEQVANKPEIKKDTFLVKDVTDDNKPDIILFKKDGSKVIFDLVDGTVKQ